MFSVFIMSIPSDIFSKVSLYETINLTGFVSLRTQMTRHHSLGYHVLSKYSRLRLSTTTVSPSYNEHNKPRYHYRLPSFFLNGVPDKPFFSPSCHWHDYSLTYLWYDFLWTPNLSYITSEYNWASSLSHNLTPRHCLLDSFIPLFTP